MIFNPFFHPLNPWRDVVRGRVATGPARFPAVQAWVGDDAVLVEALLPGVAADDLEIVVEGDDLVLEGELRTTQEPPPLRRERARGRFRRRLTLPFPVDPDATEAELLNGVLRVHLTRTEESGPVRITIHEEGDAR